MKIVAVCPLLSKFFVTDSITLLTASIELFVWKVMKLKAAIKYGEEDLVSAKVLMENSPEDDPDTEVNHGCLLYKVYYNLLLYRFLSEM